MRGLKDDFCEPRSTSPKSMVDKKRRSPGRTIEIYNGELFHYAPDSFASAGGVSGLLMLAGPRISTAQDFTSAHLD